MTLDGLIVCSVGAASPQTSSNGTEVNIPFSSQAELHNVSQMSCYRSINIGTVSILIEKQYQHCKDILA